jgi:hypothetical protein
MIEPLRGDQTYQQILFMRRPCWRVEEIFDEENAVVIRPDVARA